MTKVRNYIRGDSRLIASTWVAPDGVTPINITGCTVFFTLNSSQTPTDGGTDTTAVIKKSTSSHICPANVTLPDGRVFTAGQNTAALGVSWVSLLNTDTQPLLEQIYWYDVQLKDGAGNIISKMRDTFQVIDDITTRIS